MKKTIMLFYVFLALAILFSSCSQNGKNSSENASSLIISESSSSNTDSFSSADSESSASSSLSAVSTISTVSPTNNATMAPTKATSIVPTKTPTRAPTMIPTKAPTKIPTMAPTKAPTKIPTKMPTLTPTTAISSTTSSNTQNNRILIQSFTFNPSSLTVNAGTTVIWENQDSASHNIVIGSFTSPTFGSGGTYSRIFNTAGIYNYSCGLHPYMTGTIIVN
ncbi:MAG: cupredoxin domain-containing protein [Saccharofermentanales bacterium]